MIKSRAAKAALPKAMKHQVASLKHDEDNPRVFDLSDAGTGKTFVRIVAFAKRRRAGGGCLIVLAPRSLLRSAWANDFRKFAPDMKVSIASANVRQEAFDADADAYIVNHDGVKFLAKQKAKFFGKFSELVIDESPAFKHHTSARSRAAVKVVKYFDQRKLLTATPTTNSITDIWQQVFLLDNGARIGASFFGFRNSVSTPTKIRGVAAAAAATWTDKDGAEEAVFDLISDITVRHKLRDCVDIPPTHTYTIPYEMTPKQRKLYEQLEDDKLLPIIGSLQDQVAAALKGNKAPKGNILAINAAAVVTKLLQLASGAVYDSTGGYSVICNDRYELTMDLAQARQHPLVFFLWKHQRDLLVAEAERRGMTYAVIDGKTSDKERAEFVTRYQAKQYDVLFAHPKSAAHGLTLTAGTSTIWPSPTHDLEWFVQGNSRQARIGQKDKTEVITLLADDSRDHDVYHGILMPKEGRMSKLLQLFLQGMADKKLGDP
jgi:SNF2 family DNA or RNA helicase